MLCIHGPATEGEVASVFQPAGCLPGGAVEEKEQIVMQRQAS